VQIIVPLSKRLSMPFEGMTCLDPFDFQPFSLILVGIFMNIVALKVLNY